MLNLEYAINSNFEVREPRRGTDYSAGFDIFCPELNDSFLKALHGRELTSYEKSNVGHTSLRINPNSSIVIPTGLKFITPEGTYLEVKNRSSIAARKRLICGACVIDSDYTGEVFINLINVGDDYAKISPGEAIAQIIHKEYLHSTLTKIEPEAYSKSTKRGSGALGSTDVIV